MKNTAKCAWSFSRNYSFLRGLFFYAAPCTVSSSHWGSKTTNWVGDWVGEFLSTQFLRIYRRHEFLTLRVKSMWQEVNGHLMFFSISGILTGKIRPTVVLQCFDAVGLVIWPIKIVSNMTYNVFGGTLNPTLLLLLKNTTNSSFKRANSQDLQIAWISNFVSKEHEVGSQCIFLFFFLCFFL